MSAVLPLTSSLTNPTWLSASRIHLANTIFSGKIDVHPVIVKETMYRLPFSLVPQVAFVGRSNVGKSSLINSLLHGREVARSSPLPGRTRQLFTFDIGNSISLVDLPGYGFAGKISKADRDDWVEMIKLYIENANGLERIVSLIDCCHGLKKIDEDFWLTLSQSPIHPKRKNKPQIMVCLTKTDLIDPESLTKTSKAIFSMMEHHRKNHDVRIWPFIHAVSAETGFGLKELRGALTSMCPAEIRNSR